jgi:hypothetical protein
MREALARRALTALVVVGGFAALLPTGNLFIGSASAALFTVSAGNNPQPDEQNVINNACTGEIDGPALIISGCLNQNHDVIVKFTAEELIKYAAGGQAKIVSDDGNGFSTLTVQVFDKDSNVIPFVDLILNIDAIADGSVTFASNLGTSAAQPLDKNGQNFFTLIANSGQFFNAVTLTSTTNVVLDSVPDENDQVAQVRISGPQGVTLVPEPTTLSIFGIGLLATGFFARRRARSA